ncbi:hypothetical protein M413DRAFT_367932 [Hebeloma cylindrosporum]|uniref:Uncharacterized protein n=1 Tax=Hebeloma cylindrosporum TaxID=76867 RepID=A0A0C3C809_HEBCY|nr:hypothetical protein M413DRAFT_367932 [Hebeloma cylindrosporum h7]
MPQIALLRFFLPIIQQPFSTLLHDFLGTVDLSGLLLIFGALVRFTPWTTGGSSNIVYLRGNSRISTDTQFVEPLSLVKAPSSHLHRSLSEVSSCMLGLVSLFRGSRMRLWIYFFISFFLAWTWISLSSIYLWICLSGLVEPSASCP